MKPKTITKIACVLPLLADPVLAQEEAANSGVVDSSISSRQIWNGMVLHDAPVWRNELRFVLGPATIAVSDNIGKEDEGVEYRLRDASAILYHQAGPVGVFGGAARYEWIDYATTELYAGMTLPAIPLAPTLTLTNDLKSGWHARAEAEKGISITDKINLELALGVDYGHLYNDEHIGFRHALGIAGITGQLVDKQWKNARLDVSAGASYRGYVPLSKGYKRINEGSFRVTGGLRW